jgi:hypothetical protein
MRDKSLIIWLIVLFGISGIAVLMLAWLWPILESERILATFVGSAGLFMAITRILMLKRLSGGIIDDEHVQVKVEVEKKP